MVGNVGTSNKSDPEIAIEKTHVPNLRINGGTYHIFLAYFLYGLIYGRYHPKGLPPLWFKYPFHQTNPPNPPFFGSIPCGSWRPWPMYGATELRTTCKRPYKLWGYGYLRPDIYRPKTYGIGSSNFYRFLKWPLIPGS